jgi:hypothetical protein
MRSMTLERQLKLCFSIALLMSERLSEAHFRKSLKTVPALPPHAFRDSLGERWPPTSGITSYARNNILRTTSEQADKKLASGVLQGRIKRSSPLHLEFSRADSGQPNQPCDEQGPNGAMSRINDSADSQGLGHAIYLSIENSACTSHYIKIYFDEPIASTTA